MADPLEVACPDCGAGVGEPCMTQAQRMDRAMDYEPMFQRAARAMIIGKYERELAEAETGVEVRAVARNIEAVRDPKWKL